MDNSDYTHALPQNGNCFDCFNKDRCLAKRLEYNDVIGLSSLLSSNITYHYGNYLSAR